LQKIIRHKGNSITMPAAFKSAGFDGKDGAQPDIGSIPGMAA
jgi:hypothetical protein